MGLPVEMIALIFVLALLVVVTVHFAQRAH